MRINLPCIIQKLKRKKHNFNLLLNSCPDVWNRVFTVLRCSSGGSHVLLTDFPVSALVLRLWPGFWLCLMNHGNAIQLWAIHREQDSINTVLRLLWLGIPLKDADNSSVFFFFTQWSKRGNHKFIFHMLQSFPRSLSISLKKFLKIIASLNIDLSLKC